MKFENSTMPKKCSNVRHECVRYRIIFAVYLIACVLIVGVAQAASTSLTVVDDTHIRNGLGSQYLDPDQELIVGGTGSGQTGRGLLQFDTTSLRALGDIDVISVELVGQNTSGTGQGSSSSFDVYEYAFPFVASAATWADPDGDGSSGTGDTTAGGTLGSLVASVSNHSINPNVVATFTSTAAFETVLEAALNSSDRFDLLVKRTSEPNSNNFTRFRDHTYASGRFTLNIEYEILPPAGTVLIVK